MQNASIFRPLLRAFRSRRLAKATLTAIGSACALAAPLRPAMADEKVIGISFPNASIIGAVVTEIEAAKKKGAEMGYKVVVDDPGTDLNKQINTLKTWTEQKIACMVVNTMQPAAFESVAKQARADGIKWITYGQKIDNQDATVGYAQYKDGRTLGEAAGQWITDTQGGKAKVMILGYEKGVWGQQRGSGIKDGLKAKAPNAEIVAEQDAISPTEGLNTTRSILRGASRRQCDPGRRRPGYRGRLQGLDRGRKGQVRPERFHRRHGRDGAGAEAPQGGRHRLPRVHGHPADRRRGGDDHEVRRTHRGQERRRPDRPSRTRHAEVAQGGGISTAARGGLSAPAAPSSETAAGTLPGGPAS